MSHHHPIVEASTQALKTVCGWLWLRVSRIHRIWRSRRKPARTPSILVVGSLRAGGTGKTDLVAWIAQRHPDLAILLHPTGDEDQLLSGRFGRRVFAHGDLLVAWGNARKAGFQAAVSDGGLQDPALESCPAICVDLDTPPRLADLLPFGRYRELSPHPRKELLRASLRTDLSPTMDSRNLPPAGSVVVAACAVARPLAFFDNLEAVGLVLAARRAFGDHRRFGESAIRDTVAEHPGIAWVVTEKDSARGELARLPAGSFAVERKLSPCESFVEAVDGMTHSVRPGSAPLQPVGNPRDQVT